METMARNQAAPRRHEDLPYAVELWRAAPAVAVERVLARAASAQLAQAIFVAVQKEHPDRRITVRKGKSIVNDTAAPAHES